MYTIGFFDVMQDILAHTSFRTEILSNVWRGFLSIAEAALQVSFRSDYLKLYQSQQVAMAELLFAREQLTEVRRILCVSCIPCSCTHASATFLCTCNPDSIRCCTLIGQARDHTTYERSCSLTPCACQGFPSLMCLYASSRIRSSQSHTRSCQSHIRLSHLPSQAKQETTNTERAISWLTAAHAEERGARQALKASLQEAQAGLERERAAHQAALSKYIVEVEDK